MRRLRIVIPLLVVLIAAALAVRWMAGTRGFATPTECIEAYREASLAGDVPRYLDCLAEPLRARMLNRFADPQRLGMAIKEPMQDIKNWGQSVERTEGEPTAFVNVDEVRATGTRRVRYHLEQTGRGWLISAIDPPREVPTPIPFGTHIGEAPEQPR
jgi:hypothetical protein